MATNGFCLPLKCVSVMKMALILFLMVMFSMVTNFDLRPQGFTAQNEKIPFSFSCMSLSKLESYFDVDLKGFVILLVVLSLLFVVNT